MNKPIETSNQESQEYRSHTGRNGVFPNGKVAFNELCQIPDGPIRLDEKRELHIARWCTDGDESILGGADALKVTIQGQIRLTPEERKRLQEENAASIQVQVMEES